MGLFDKKYCDVCGNEIKTILGIGGKKIENGHICKDCAAKLSPWFSGRKHTTLEDINKQLEYREYNQQKLAEFNPTLVLGRRYKFYIDEPNERFVVSSSSNWRAENPDIINFEDVDNLEIEIDEEREEIFDEDSEGKEISFDPKKYEYEYDFRCHIYVRNDFFDEMSFDLISEKPESPESDLYKEYVEMCKNIMKVICNKEFVEDRSQFTFKNEKDEKEEPKKEWFCPSCGTKNEGNFCTKCGTPKPVMNAVRFCGNCGAKITDADVKFCPNCGNKL